MVLKMCLTLGAVCILAFFILRYGLPKLTGLQPNSELIRLVTRFPLDQQKALYIVEVAGKTLLLGVTNERIELLAQLEKEEIQQVLQKTPPNTPVKDFSKYLRR